ncbi:MAG: hypothetical protein ICV79_27925 [Flavisolibacter sp.]|nr:hypothetical protein [Flavisolibacter sp.]
MKQPPRIEKHDFCVLCPFNGNCAYRNCSPGIKLRSCGNYQQIKAANEAPVKRPDIDPYILSRCCIVS